MKSQCLSACYGWNDLASTQDCSSPCALATIPSYLLNAITYQFAPLLHHFFLSVLDFSHKNRHVLSSNTSYKMYTLYVFLILPRNTSLKGILDFFSPIFVAFGLDWFCFKKKKNSVSLFPLLLSVSLCPFRPKCKKKKNLYSVSNFSVLFFSISLFLIKNFYYEMSNIHKSRENNGPLVQLQQLCSCGQCFILYLHSSSLTQDYFFKNIKIYNMKNIKIPWKGI
jgi:uncharacterized protein with PQ loop repeat